MLLTIALVVHLLCSTVWVGGMFLMHVCLRPNLEELDPPQRLRLMHGTLGRFFPWVMLSVVALLISGYALVFLGYGGFAGLPVPFHIMQLTGLVMMALFLHLYFAPWKRMRRAVAEADWPGAGKQLGQIRLFVTINLVLGLLTVTIGGLGRYL